jgi:hypothetical protein
MMLPLRNCRPSKTRFTSQQKKYDNFYDNKGLKFY